jgi:hypothetical protein
MSDEPMAPEHEAHLQRVLTRFTRALSQKYRAGQREHGGNLWTKRGMLDRAIEEAIDQAIYLMTLREQIENGFDAADALDEDPNDARR